MENQPLFLPDDPELTEQVALDSVGEAKKAFDYES